MSKPPPKRAHTLDMQVGGHKGVQQSGEGDLIMKPCLPAERDFYQAVAADERLSKLRGHVPQFYGTLRLEGKVDVEAAGGDVGADQLREVLAKSADDKGKDECFRLLLFNMDTRTHNLSHRFRKPNILDIKLGKVLYDETANEEKKARMIKVAAETTSFETGVRLTGFSVYDPASQTYTVTPKEYGKSIKAEQLVEGTARFFPESVPREALLKVLGSVHDKVLEIQQALAETEIRMVGGSLLIVWEGDPAALAKAIEAADSGRDVMEEEDEGEEDELDENSRKPGPVCVVKLIDFAHTRLVPGEGPDEGVMTGVGTTLKLLENRIHELRKS
ncbi:inositol-hexakisphosphate kinase [Ceratobasidium sp. AG-Ba]|nr:inositol-hexakisphosphate kinase [Ceratobasidium sp. AG-Ba]QRW15455.1 inositol-hexakisphosphate kinase [Ceratobasidium sp. AG-Ba]